MCIWRAKKIPKYSKSLFSAYGPIVPAKIVPFHLMALGQKFCHSFSPYALSQSFIKTSSPCGLRPETPILSVPLNLWLKLGVPLFRYPPPFRKSENWLFNPSPSPVYPQRKNRPRVLYVLPPPEYGFMCTTEVDPPPPLTGPPN